MNTFDAIEKLALELPEKQQATLANHMLHSLPAMFSEPDDGLAEARRRDAELDTAPAIALSMEEFDAKIAECRTK